LKAVFKRDLINQVSGQQVFKAGGMVFSVQHQVLKFVEENGVKDCGLFPDPFAIWFLTTPTPGSGQEDAARVVSAKKAGRTARESDLLATLKFDQPPLLFGTTTSPGCVKLAEKNKGFGANLATFKIYDETTTCMRTTIITQLDDWLTSMTSDIDLSDPVQHLVKSCVKWVTVCA
jgi:hypothetical protein